MMRRRLLVMSSATPSLFHIWNRSSRGCMLRNSLDSSYVIWAAMASGRRSSRATRLSPDPRPGAPYAGANVTDRAGTPSGREECAESDDPVSSDSDSEGADGIRSERELGPGSNE